MAWVLDYLTTSFNFNMINIFQGPQARNFSLSLPDISISADTPHVYIRVTPIGGSPLIDERYDVAPNGKVQIKFAELLDLMLSSNLPDYNQTITEHPAVSQTFLLEYRANDTDPWEALDPFEVLKGYLRPQPFDVDGYFTNNWLSLIPQISEVYYHQPLYLTARPFTNVEVKVKALMADNTEKTIVLGTFVANKVQSVNINPGKLKLLLNGDYHYFDVFTEQGGIMRNGLKRFYYAPHLPYQSDMFLYLNRIGGWDSIVMDGQRSSEPRTEIASAIFGDRTKEYNNEISLIQKKNTGYIRSEVHRRQLVDFLQSKQRYHFFEGKLHPIVLSNPQFEHTRGALESFNFDFAYSDAKIAYPEIGLTTNFLNI